MIKGANTVGFLPRTSERPSWLPVDYAGRAIAEIVLAPPAPGARVYHVVNPNISATWDDLLNDLQAAGLKFEVVDIDQWLDRLDKSNKDPTVNPVIKLQDFFKKRYATKRAAMVFETSETSKVSPSIREAPGLSPKLVQKWVDHWRAVGFLA